MISQNITFFEDSNAFLDHTLAVFKADETRHRLMLGIALILQKQPNAFGEETPLMAARVGQDNMPDFIALMTPPFPMLVWFEDSFSGEDLKAMAKAIKEKGWDLPGVNGIATCSCRFAPVWSEICHTSSTQVMRSRSYELSEVLFPNPMPAGTFQFAGEQQAETLLEYFNKMQDDIGPTVPTRYTLEHMLSFIANKRIAVWLVDGQAVSMAMSNRPQLTSIGISAVYTPNAHRRHGYASALVASLSQELLDQGYQRINLFTDLANPTSNKIYKAIGFKEVCDYQEYKFT